MPRRAPRACSEPLCPALVTGRLAKCPKHERQRRRRHDDRRPGFTERGYGPQWPAIRRAVLAEQPLCEQCLADSGRVTAATVVDHVVRLRDGGTHDRRNLMSLCTTCHGRKSCAEGNADRRRGSP